MVTIIYIHCCDEQINDENHISNDLPWSVGSGKAERRGGTVTSDVKQCKGRGL